MRFYTKPRRTPTINIVSLIDILCIVLIFFIVTTTFRKDDPTIKIDLPESTQAKPTKDIPPTIISVTKAGIIFLDTTPVSPESLAVALKRKLSADPTAKVALKASKDAAFGVIVKVMDAVRGAGLESLPTFTEETTPAESMP
jgi:biopolymer transport protein ExbD